MRKSACLTKDLQDDGGVRPYLSVKDVLLDLFVSKWVHVKMKDYTMDTKVYLVPFEHNVSVERELRVFVYNNRVLAIFQYDVFNSSSAFSPIEDTELCKLVHLINDFHCKYIKSDWTRSGGIDSYLMDVEYISGKGIWLFELKSFGAKFILSLAPFY